MLGLPLIWQFAERINTEEPCTSVFYNNKRNLNCIDIEGAEIPLVHAKAAGLGTMTFTEARGEETDQDPMVIDSFYGTATITRAKAEATDED